MKFSMVVCVQRFTGYRTNGMLIRVSGCLQSLYPSDGGLIDVEAVNYVEGVELSRSGSSEAASASGLQSREFQPDPRLVPSQV